MMAADRIYFAPMEGITGHIYRNAHAKHYPGVDRYYLPFIAVHATHNMKNKEKKDISPAQNVGLCAIPQVLTRNVDDFLWAADELRILGYREINLNFGCPSPTVTSKGKGAAFLGLTDEMDRFLDGIFNELDRRGLLAASPKKPEMSYTKSERDPEESYAESACGQERLYSQSRGGGTEENSSEENSSYDNKICVSVKTRIGVERVDEWERIFAIYNQYPISELTVHARTMREFYNGEAHPEIFGEILRMTRIPVVYNGNVFSVKEYRELRDLFKAGAHFSGIMIGRGLIQNPALVQQIRGGEGLSAGNLMAFHDEVLSGYQRELSGDTHVISKMKALWWYMGRMFSDADKPLKRVKKAKNVREYRAAVRELLSCDILQTDESV